MAGSDNLQAKINQYEGMLFGIAYLRTGSRQDAEDVVQETFYSYLVYLRKGNVFTGEEHEKAWLIRVAINACRKLRRSAWVRNQSGQAVEHVSEQAVAGQAGGDTENLGTQPVVPEEQILRREAGEELLKAVLALPVKYRDVIHLFYYEDLSVKEIGVLLGRRESTVTSQLSRGRALLRKSLREEYDFAQLSGGI